MKTAFFLFFSLFCLILVGKKGKDKFGYCRVEGNMTNPKNFEKINGKLWKNFKLKNFQSNQKTRGTGQVKMYLQHLDKVCLKEIWNSPKNSEKKVGDGKINGF